MRTGWIAHDRGEVGSPNLVGTHCGLLPEGGRTGRPNIPEASATKRSKASSQPPDSNWCAAQTVDQVLIINRGRLVVESALDQLTADSDDAVRVLSARPEKLAAALERESLNVTANGDTLLVAGATCERVGEIAFAAGIALHELVSEASSLEDVFLELTANTAP